MNYKTIIMAALCSTALVNCGNSTSSSSSSNNTNTTTVTLTGVVVDAPVGGLAYTSGSVSGKTDLGGTFSYEVGKSVKFSVGDVTVGSYTPSATSNIITPLELTGAADNTVPVVQGMAQFLMTLDDDNDPTNGISITPAVHTAATGQVADISVAGTNITTLLTAIAPAKTIVTAAVATAHLNRSRLIAMSGKYSGTFTGTCDMSPPIFGGGSATTPITGTLTQTIDSYGNISGTALDNLSAPPTPTAYTGTVDALGVMAGTFPTRAGSSWNMNYAINGSNSGTWQFPTDNATYPSCSGTATGSRITSGDVTIYDGSYSGSFVGTLSQGTWQMTVANGVITSGSSSTGLTNITGTVSVDGAVAAVGFLNATPAINMTAQVNSIGGITGSFTGIITTETGTASGFKQ